MRWDSLRFQTYTDNFDVFSLWVKESTVQGFTHYRVLQKLLPSFSCLPLLCPSTPSRSSSFSCYKGERVFNANLCDMTAISLGMNVLISVSVRDGHAGHS